MITLESAHKILWVLEPSQVRWGRKVEGLTQFLNHSKEAGVELEPVLLVSSADIRISVRRESLRSLRSSFVGAPVAVGFPKIFLTCGSAAKSASSVIEYANVVQADVIAVGSTAGHSWPKRFRGDLADRLMMQSDRPVISVPVEAWIQGRPCFGKILFPTDFSLPSYRTFEKLLRTAHATGSSILLFYKCEYIVPETYEMVHNLTVYSEFLTRDIEEHFATAETWIVEAARAGVEADFVFDEEAHYLGDSIVEAAEKYRATLIALASPQERSSRHFQRSLSAQIAHGANFPVWAYRPSERELKAA